MQIVDLFATRHFLKGQYVYYALQASVCRELVNSKAN